MPVLRPQAVCNYQSWNLNAGINRLHEQILLGLQVNTVTGASGLHHV